MDGLQQLNHRYADFQSGVRKLLALYFNKLPGRPLPILQYNAGQCTASSRKTHASFFMYLGCSCNTIFLVCFAFPHIEAVGYLSIRARSKLSDIVPPNSAAIWFVRRVGVAGRWVGDHWKIALSFKRGLR